MDFKELNVDLDKYTRAFDVIDILYQSLRTSLNVYSTYNSVSEPSRRLQRFAGRLLYESGGTEQDGTDGYTDYRHQLAVCAEDCKRTVSNSNRSMSDLVLYATGAAACSTSDLLLVLESINQGLDNIERHLNKDLF